MTLEEMKQHEWTVSWSGGKDSTATIILMHENNIPIKEIVYVRMMFDDELPATLPVMTEFVDRAKTVFESWGYKVTIVKSNKTAMEVVNTVFRRSKYPERNGKKYGVIFLSRKFCAFTKIKQLTIKSLNIQGYEMIGYAADETRRLHRLDENKQSIMVALGITESQTFDICRKYNLLSPLYDLGFPRDGCFFCPNMNKKEIQYLHENRLDLVKKIFDIIKNTEIDISNVLNNWLEDYKKCK